MITQRYSPPCISCEQPVEDASRGRLLQDARISLDRRGRRVERASTVTGGANLDVRVFGDLHASCIVPYLLALLEQAGPLELTS